MAIEKTITNEAGVEVTYWKVTVTNIDWKIGIAYVSLAGYVNKQARIDGKEPVVIKGFRFEDFSYEDNPIAQSYEKIKGTDEFADAIDC